VIGNREQGDAVLNSALTEFYRAQSAVGGVGMGMQINLQAITPVALKICNENSEVEALGGRQYISPD
jgi:hypothetical protein